MSLFFHPSGDMTKPGVYIFLFNLPLDIIQWYIYDLFFQPGYRMPDEMLDIVAETIRTTRCLQRRQFIIIIAPLRPYSELVRRLQYC